CVDPPPDCVVDGDCAAGEVCRAGVCEPGPVVVPACNAPIPAGVGRYVGTTAGMGATAGSCHGGVGSPEVAYALNLPAGEYCLMTEGSVYDTSLHVRTTCADVATEVACNDDAADFGLQSALSFQAAAGTTYYAFVDGFSNNASGDYVLTVLPGACPAAGDQGVCEPPGTPIALGGRAEGSTVDAEGLFGASCGGGAGSPDAVFTFSRPQTGPVCFTTAGSSYDTVLHARTVCGDQATEVGCNDDSDGLQSELTFNAVGGQVYFVVVDGYSGDRSGDYVLQAFDGACP
ncbi:MAG: hypothetical protein KC620_16950, partial [Myxococcales bacterium]|nr:hypothetical protein [Myxococcales bacterium]